MDILHFHQTDQGGGGAKIVRKLHAEVNKKSDKITSTLIVGNKQSDNENVYEFPSIPFENVLNHLLERVFSLEGLGSPSAFLIRKIIENYDPDIIHLHNIHGGYFNFLALERIPNDIPIVWTFHDMWPLTGHCTYSFDCQKYQDGCGNCPYLDIPQSIKVDTTKYLQKLKSIVFSKNNLRIVSPSLWMHNNIQNSTLSARKTVHIPHGIDTDEFSPINQECARQSFGIPTEDTVLLFIANSLSNKRKGITDLFGSLQQLGIDDLSLLIIGGDDFPDSEIPERYDTYNPGYVPNNELPAVYSAADICVIPSLYESFGLVATESMACETPIVAYNTSGLKEQVNASVGWLADFKSVPSLTEKILKALENEDQRRIKAKRARQHVLENFNQDTFIKSHVDLYQKLL